MKQTVVGIAEFAVSGDPGDTIVTYALGSCVAVALYDPARRVGGLLHLMLPESSLDPGKAAVKPCMFADTGLALLFRAAYERGAEKRRLVVRIAGGAQVMDPNGVFSIGKRNVLAVRKLLWKAGIFLAGEAVGGEVNRTVRLEVASGRFWVREGAQGEAKLLNGSGPVRPAGGE